MPSRIIWKLAGIVESAKGAAIVESTNYKVREEPCSEAV
jgi:hypothetical protein